MRWLLLAFASTLLVFLGPAVVRHLVRQWRLRLAGVEVTGRVSDVRTRTTWSGPERVGRIRYRSERAGHVLVANVPSDQLYAKVPVRYLRANPEIADVPDSLAALIVATIVTPIPLMGLLLLCAHLLTTP